MNDFIVISVFLATLTGTWLVIYPTVQSYGFIVFFILMIGYAKLIGMIRRLIESRGY